MIRFPYVVVYKDAEGEWWYSVGDEVYEQVANLTQLPRDYAKKVSVLQHCDIYGGIKNVGKRVAKNKYWIYEQPIGEKQIDYLLQLYTLDCYNKQ